jgi:hypothetical protein
MVAIAVNLTLLYIDPRAVIPAPYQVRGKLQQESSSKNTGFPRVKHGAGSVRPGMTNKVKGLDHTIGNDRGKIRKAKIWTIANSRC